jgi:transposase
MKLSEIFENVLLASASKLAPPLATGRPRLLDDATSLNCIWKLLRTGCQWRELDCHGASYMTLHRRLRLWEEKGVIEDAYTRALKVYSKLRSPKRHLVDSSHVRNRHGRQPDTGRNHVDRGRQGVKVSVITDESRIVYGMHTNPSNRPDVTLLSSTLTCRWVQLDDIELFADRGYDSRANRKHCTDHGLRDRIFRRRTETTRRTNAKRVVVEHVFAHLQSFRRLSFCYEMNAGFFRAFCVKAFGHRLGIELSKISENNLCA